MNVTVIYTALLTYMLQYFKDMQFIIFKSSSFEWDQTHVSTVWSLNMVSWSKGCLFTHCTSYSCACVWVWPTTCYDHYHHYHHACLRTYIVHFLLLNADCASERSVCVKSYHDTKYCTMLYDTFSHPGMCVILIGLLHWGISRGVWGTWLCYLGLGSDTPNASGFGKFGAKLGMTMIAVSHSQWCYVGHHQPRLKVILSGIWYDTERAISVSIQHHDHFLHSCFKYNVISTQLRMGYHPLW